MNVRNAATVFMAMIGGAALSAAATVLIAEGQPQTPVASRTTATNGRYQIVFSPAARADTFLLDTETGRIWRPTAYTTFEGDPVVWDYQERVDTLDQLKAWSKGLTLKAK